MIGFRFPQIYRGFASAAYFGSVLTCGLLTLAPDAPAQVPVNDNFANATEITSTNATVYGNNVNATMEPGEPDGGGSDGNSVWWYWQAPPGAGYATISTDGSESTLFPGYTLYADLEIYTGTSVSDLNYVSSGNSDASDGYTASFRTVPGTIYRIAVDGVNYYYDTYDYPEDTDVGSIVLSVSFSPGLPLAAAWDLPDSNGQDLNSASFGGKVVLLNFWATWCGPCCDELPDLIALEQKYSPDGLEIVGLSVDDAVNGQPPTALVSATMAQYGINYPVAMTRPDGYSTEQDYGGIPYIPNTFIIDRQNHIEQVYVGEQDYSTYERAILPLLYSNLKVNLSVANGMIHVNWPVTQATFTLESTGDLASGVWTVVATSIQSDGVNNFMDLPAGSSNIFYRLHLQ